LGGNQNIFSPSAENNRDNQYFPVKLAFLQGEALTAQYFSYICDEVAAKRY
jgi:hypothetical protein